jgi:hypothetical protein
MELKEFISESLKQIIDGIIDAQTYAKDKHATINPEGVKYDNQKKKACQQSVHLTLGILRTSQAVFYALSFFWLDGFAVPAPAQVTQTVEAVEKVGRI